MTMIGLYGVFEAAVVGGAVLAALGYAGKRWWPRRRAASTGPGCDSGCGSGGCGSCEVQSPASRRAETLHPVRIVARHR